MPKIIFLSRMILVVYAERGLVLKGMKNIKLFNILYWVTFITYLVNFFFIYMPTLEETKEMCLLTSLFSKKKRRIAYIFFNLDWIAIWILEKMKRKSLRRQCLNRRTYAAVGGVKKSNIFNGEETKIYCLFLLIYVIVEDLLLISAMEYELVDIEMAVTLNNSAWLIILVVVFALYVPIKHLAESKVNFPEIWLQDKKFQIDEFYVRKPDLIPKRDFFVSKICQNKKTVPCKNRITTIKTKKITKTNHKEMLHKIAELPEIDI